MGDDAKGAFAADEEVDEAHVGFDVVAGGIFGGWHLVGGECAADGGAAGGGKGKGVVAGAVKVALQGKGGAVDKHDT